VEKEREKEIGKEERESKNIKRKDKKRGVKKLY
jgi:hypothetical protein